MKRNSLLFLAITLCISCIAQTPKYQGLLWKITGNGLDKPSYLYGTMHVSNKVAFHLSDSFYKAIESVDVVSLEINPETWMETMTNDDFVADNMGNVFSVRGNNQSAGFYKALFAIDPPENKAIGAALRAELGILNSLLYRTNSYSADFQEDTYLDLFIYQAGKKQGKKIAGLEKIEATMLLNEMAEKPEHDKKKKKELKELAERKQHVLAKLVDGKSYGEVMENAYRLGDLDLLDSMSRMAGTDKNHSLIIVYRNIGMADAMDSIMKEKSLFAGVGAAHLPNSYGVINLLRKKGYTVSPVNGEKSEFGMQVKDRLEETFLESVFTKQISFDGSFSIMMPGPLYEFPESGGTTMVAYADMANGAKYVVTRINTFSTLYGRTQEQYLDKIDSLFFENIPGKILEKKRIEIDGVPGFDIISKTKKGDVQRYHIMVTAVELLIFKVSGKKEFVNRTEVAQFFEELHFYKTAGWKKYVPKNTAYSVEMPGTHIYEAENNSFMRGFWEKTVQSYDSDNGYFAVFNKSHMDIEHMEEDSFELHHISRYFTHQLDYDIKRKEHDSTQGYASYSLKATNVDRPDLFLKEVLVGNQYYLLVAQTDDAQAASKFLRSVKFLPYSFSRKFEQKYDSARLFSVVTSVRPPAQVGSYYNYYGQENEDDESHLDETKTAVYYNKESDETIYARMYRYHKYYFQEEIDTIWNFYQKQILQDKFFVRSEKKSLNENIHTYEIEVGDTNTNRNILVKHFLKDGALYSLFTENDFRKPRSKFVDQFFSTFSPWDTVIGTPVLQNKVDMFLADLVSEDSTTREAAAESFDQVHFEDEDAPKFIAAYQNNRGFKQSLDNRTELIDAIGELKHSSVTPFLVEVYKEVKDSVQFQMPVLRSLAKQKSKKAANAFAMLIVEETPLTDNTDAIERMFYPFYDSLSLAKELFPEVLILTALPEYKVPVYNLLSTLLDSNLIRTRSYKRYVKQMAWEANNEVKRQRGSESHQTADFYKEESRQTLYNYNELLEYYAILLHPFYRNSKVKKFFSRASSINSRGFKIDLALIQLGGGDKVSKSTWENICKNKNDRIVVYQRLKKIDKLDLFPIQYTHDTLAMALFAQKARVNQYKDSLVFVSKHWISESKDSGYLYFFKNKEKSEDWTYGYIGPIDTTVAVVERYTYDFDDNVSVNKYEDESLQIRKKLVEYRMRNRKRYRASDDPEFDSLTSVKRRFRYGGY
ncbi:TraB/GumN family protein [Bacteroidia bacterium]|nr:TraB/GumN family protein [Bacteroidia bacterium]